MHLAHTTLAQFTLVRVTFIQIGDLHVVVQYTTGLATKKRQFVTDAGRIADRIGVRLAVVGWLITEAAPVDLAVGILAAEGCVIAQAFSGRRSSGVGSDREYNQRFHPSTITEREPPRVGKQRPPRTYHPNRHMRFRKCSCFIFGTFMFTPHFVHIAIFPARELGAVSFPLQLGQ